MTERCLTDDELNRLLRDDAPYGDLTTRLMGIGGQPGRMIFHARRPMVVSCLEEAARMIELAGCPVETLVRSGDAVAAEVCLLRAEGRAGDLHRVWKTAQTLVDYASGIATATADIVAAARAADPLAVIACTRKNAPGTKAIAAKAVVDGGGEMHRLGLSESILVFPEHLAFLSPDEARSRIGRLRTQCPEKVVVVEVKTIAEALVVTAAGAQVLQLERFSPEDVAQLAARLGDTGTAPVLAAAGGVTAHSAAAYVRAGARILVTSAPYGAPPQDIRVTIAAG